jgi:hypothetical protein
MQEKIKKLNKDISEYQNTRKNMQTAIIILKKQTDRLREKVIKEDRKSKEFLFEISTLIENNKFD